MSRYEGEFTAASNAPLSVQELLDVLAEQPAMTPEARQAAIACYLSGGDGWSEALKALGGAFASDAAEVLRLRAGKAG